MAKILFLAHRVPFPPNKGDKIRAFHELAHLARHHDIWLGAGADDPADLEHLAEARRRFRGAYFGLPGACPGRLQPGPRGAGRHAPQRGAVLPSGPDALVRRHPWRRPPRSCFRLLLRRGPVRPGPTAARHQTDRRFRRRRCRKMARVCPDQHRPAALAVRRRISPARALRGQGRRRRRRECLRLPDRTRSFRGFCSRKRPRASAWCRTAWIPISSARRRRSAP